MKRLATSIAAIALIGTPALAADMAVKAPPPAPAPVPYSWSGFYAGLNVGWGWGKDDETLSVPGPGPTTLIITGGGTTATASGFLSAINNDHKSTHMDGAIGGVQVGYNWQTTPKWILGIEADIQASGENGSANHQGLFSLAGGGVPPPITFNVAQSVTHNESLLWFGTVRGRVGYAFWPTVMVYGTGGLAYGRFHDSLSASFGIATNAPPSPTVFSNPFDASVTKTGWTAGAGIEGAVPNTHVTWKLEYLYMDLGTRNFTFVDPTFGTFTLSDHFTDNIVRVGLNYQFH